MASGEKEGRKKERRRKRVQGGDIWVIAAGWSVGRRLGTGLAPPNDSSSPYHKITQLAPFRSLSHNLFLRARARKKKDAASSSWVKSE
jgi:hypothetical protein